MILTRQEKEKLIIDLYNQGRTYQQIAVEARVSVRDIKPVLEKAENERAKELGIPNQEREENSSNIPQQQKPSSLAYYLFSQGKTPLEVAVELNIRETEATKYYREYWKLRGLYRLNQIYEDIKEDISHIIRLYRRMKAERIGIEQVIRLTKIANNVLPAVEHEYHELKRDVKSLESRKSNEYRTLHQVQDQIADSKRILKQLRTLGQEEEASIIQLQRERIRLKRLVNLFKDNDEYLKVKKTVEDKVSSILLENKRLLRLAFYSVIKSIRKDPEKHSALIHYASYSDAYYTSYFGNRNGKYPYQLNSYDSFFEALESTILEDAEKFYEQLLKEQVNTIITKHIFECNSSVLATPTNSQPIDINKGSQSD